MIEGHVGAAVVHDDHLGVHAAIETSLNLAEQASDIGVKGPVKMKRGAFVREKAGGWNPWNAIVGSFY